MDIRMPVMDGLEATRRLPRFKVLVLTTFGLDEYIVEALRAGASGFLTKDVPRQELVAAVKAVANGDAVLSARRSRASCSTASPTGSPRRRRPTASPPSPTASARSCS